MGSDTPDTSIESTFRSLARAAAWFVLALALLGFTGYLLQAPDVASLFPKRIPMAPGTAACFSLLAGALLLWLGDSGFKRGAVKAAAAAVTLTALCVLFKRPGPAVGGGAISLWEMSPFTAGLFIISSAGLLRLARSKKEADAAAIAASAAVLAASFIILLGYLYGTPYLYGGDIIPVAFSTGLDFFVLGLALFFTDTESLKATPFSGNSLKAVLLRNFLPLVVAVVLLDDWVDLWGPAFIGGKPALSAAYTLVSLVVVAMIISRVSKRIEDKVLLERRKLADSEARYRALFEADLDGILIADRETHKFKYANPAICRMLGYSVKELETLAMEDIHPQSDLPGIMERSRARDRGEKTSSAGIACLRKDGTVFYADINAASINVDGRECSIGIFRDITGRRLEEKEREELRAQLLQSQKMEAVGLLAGGVAHDFNNILTAIKGYCSLIAATFMPEDPRREDVGEIMTAADRAANLTRQLLAFSRKQIMSPRVVDLNGTLGEMVKMLRRIIGEDVRLSAKFFPAPCLALVDPGQIEQVIVNLAVNARDAISKDGEITLETEVLLPTEAFFAARPDLPRGRMVRVSIRDNGCGIGPEVMKHLFEPFFTTKERGKGTGLGLSMVYGTIKQSGGEIEVETRVGEGSVFRIYLPLAEAGAEPAASGLEGAGAGAISETILLVEDEESLRRLAARLLRAAGYTVMSAAGGKEALETAERHGRPVDLLLTDVVMPGMSGRELAKELARRGLAGRTVYMSGYTDEAIVKHGMLEPGIAFIYKPFTVEGLTIKLRQVLDGPADQARP